MNALSDLQLRVSHALTAEEERVRVKAERERAKEELAKSAAAPVVAKTVTTEVLPHQPSFATRVMGWAKEQWNKIPWHKLFNVRKED